MCEWSLGDSATRPANQPRPSLVCAAPGVRAPPELDNRCESHATNSCQTQGALMASGFYRCGQDLHPDHLDFIRPDLPLVQPSEAPRSNPQQNKAARGTESPPGPTHWPGWPGGHFLIGQPATPLFAA